MEAVCNWDRLSRGNWLLTRMVKKKTLNIIIGYNNTNNTKLIWILFLLP